MIFYIYKSVKKLSDKYYQDEKDGHKRTNISLNMKGKGISV